ncbi:MAG: Smr/MutS family protein [Rhizomicrobium sp.]|jgi:DNA-nicking Smr family endonuclease
MSGKSRTRLPSAEERELFVETFKDARVLVKKKPAAPKAPASKRIPASLPESPTPPKSPRRPTAGLDGNTADRLRRGQLDPEARLDLHGMTESTAHRALVTFLRAASARGLRLVLIVTGKGGKPSAPDAPFELDDRARGVLNAMTPRWLAEPELAGFVADVRVSHRRHGGTGALYVYLRKPKPR